MIGSITRYLSSIGVKLFLWFWLIIVISVSSTSFISHQLAQEVIILPPLASDIKKLKSTTAKISKNTPKNIQKFIQQAHFSQNSFFVIKNIQNNNIYPQPEKFNDATDYIKKSTFNNLTTIKLPDSRITGPIKISAQQTKYLLFIVHKNKRSIHMVLKQLPYWLLISIPVIISFILCWFLAKTLSKPISQMKKVANQFGNGNLAIRLEENCQRSDEIGDLARTFNNMADKIQSNVEAHQRLLGDMSHELRSPMTRLQVALALADKSKDQPETLNKHILRCEKEVENLDNMLSDVLSLSRLESSMHHIHFDKVKLSDILIPLIEDNQYLAEDKNIAITSKLLDECFIEADPQLLSSAFNNVLLNAVKYSPENSKITVQMKLVDNTVLVSISDQGSGVPEHTTESLFTPFFRTSTARERKTGGTGLGLAISKQAVLIHHGEISAQNNETDGLTVTISLPLLA
ncbi:HAMP domain-containing histidine kinase [Pseudocolwellia agarivorans]|uniref:HAMP domain-containing histidine kinase n=1 Tax=Pseudocolwellia agarivorans TaxID=1911682 RepID=UPI00098466B9|nr:HAMP domain-containing histidine kinase [Pseudocolwellia agarivorans]